MRPKQPDNCEVREIEVPFEIYRSIAWREIQDSNRVYSLGLLTRGSVGAIWGGKIGRREFRIIGKWARIDLMQCGLPTRLKFREFRRNTLDKSDRYGGGDGGIRTHDTLSGMTI